MPSTLAYLGGAFDHRKFQARWDVTYVGENNIDPLDTPVIRIPARVLHDALLSYKAPRGFKLGIDVRNVFDRKVRDLSRYPLPDRVVFVHVGWHSGAEGS